MFNFIFEKQNVFFFVPSNGFKKVSSGRGTYLPQVHTTWSEAWTLPTGTGFLNDRTVVPSTTWMVTRKKNHAMQFSPVIISDFYFNQFQAVHSKVCIKNLESPWVTFSSIFHQSVFYLNVWHSLWFLAFYIRRYLGRDVLEQTLTHEREFQIHVRVCFRVPYLLRMILIPYYPMIIIRTDCPRNNPMMIMLFYCHPIRPSCCRPIVNMEHPSISFCVFRLCYVYGGIQLASDRKELIPLR